MARRLDGKREIVTGGGSGIGRATTAVMAAQGASLCTIDLDQRSAHETADAQRVDDVTVVAAQYDVRDAERRPSSATAPPVAKQGGSPASSTR